MKKFCLTALSLIYVIFAADWTWSGAGTTINTNTAVTVTATASGTLTINNSGTVVTIVSVDNEPILINNSITVNIAEGAKVVWNAMCSKNSSGTLLTVTGSGEFEMVGGIIENLVSISVAISISGNNTFILNGGTVSAGTGDAIRVSSLQGVVRINGGLVTGRGDVIRFTNLENTIDNVFVGGTGRIEGKRRGIETYGNVIVSDEAFISSTDMPFSYAIYARGENSTVTINGGTVILTENTENLTGIQSNTIYVTQNTGDAVIINGGTVSATSGVAISAFNALGGGNVIINGGTISAESGTLISTSCNVAVYGGEVSATGDWSDAIYAQKGGCVTVYGGTVSATSGVAISASTDGGDIIIKGGTVKATGEDGHAISTYKSNVKVYDGEVSAISGTAITTGRNNKNSITVYGGTVSTVSGNAIVGSGENSITINGGTVSTVSGNAIVDNGENINITINGGTVSTVSGDAIYAWRTNCNVTINGGMLSTATGKIINEVWVGAHSYTINGGVMFAWGQIILPASLSYDGGNGVIIAWDRETWISNDSPQYDAGYTEDIRVFSNNTQAQWDIRGGIAYSNDDNIGFFAIDEVIVGIHSCLSFYWDTTSYATCATEGSRTEICVKCGNEDDTEFIPINLSNHNWDEWIETITPTCETAGEKTRICRRNAKHEETELVSNLTVEECGGNSILINNFKKNGGKAGKGILFDSNIVSDKVNISVFGAVEIKVAVYDNIGNVVFTTVRKGNKVTWDLKNSAGRTVSNGTYLIVAEVRNINNMNYVYSEKLGVKKQLYSK